MLAKDEIDLSNIHGTNLLGDEVTANFLTSQLSVQEPIPSMLARDEIDLSNIHGTNLLGDVETKVSRLDLVSGRVELGKRVDVDGTFARVQVRYSDLSCT